VIYDAGDAHEIGIAGQAEHLGLLRIDGIDGRKVGLFEAVNDALGERKLPLIPRSQRRGHFDRALSIRPPMSARIPWGSAGFGAPWPGNSNGTYNPGMVLKPSADIDVHDQVPVREDPEFFWPSSRGLHLEASHDRLAANRLYTRE
jgi:hypothetical protein